MTNSKRDIHGLINLKAVLVNALRKNGVNEASIPFYIKETLYKDHFKKQA